jgi:hypothetical protein
MPNDAAMTATELATEAARADILAAIDATGPGAIGHGPIRLRHPNDRPPAAAPGAAGALATDTPQRIGRGRIRLR